MSATSPSPSGYAIRVLLIDDQRMVGEAVRRMVVGEPNLVFEYCQNPADAVAVAERFQPTVILQDLVMPGIDGLTLVEHYRANPLTREVPTIVLSSQEDAAVKADAFARGANDYLVKLPDRIELLARIRHHSRGYIHLLERNQAFDALAASQQLLAAELAEAAEYVRSQLPAPLAGPIAVRWDFASCSSVGGDAFGYHWIDEDHFAIYLLDVCGHGVGAALLSVSVMNTISSGSLGNTDFREPGKVLTRLNQLFTMERHNNMYFTIWYGVYERTSQRLRYCTAGHPAALLFGPGGGAEPARLGIPALPIGTLEDIEFPVGEATIELGSRLYVYSDGVYEVVLTNGSEMMLDDFIPLVATQPPAVPGLASVRAAVAEMQGRDRFDDDFSLVELAFN
ncbi:MAG: response regulator [Gammaproteobacteria bacterium]|nr:response regulator [Gammaproteobacteria bacterium]